MPKNWEYMSLVVDTRFNTREMTDREFNNLGSTGWELVSFVKLTTINDNGHEVFHYRAYFKREKS